MKICCGKEKSLSSPRPSQAPTSFSAPLSTEVCGDDGPHLLSHTLLLLHLSPHLLFCLLQLGFCFHQPMKTAPVQFTNCIHVPDPKFGHSPCLTYSTIIFKTDHCLSFLIFFCLLTLPTFVIWSSPGLSCQMASVYTDLLILFYYIALNIIYRFVTSKFTSLV